jgi:hypothetical protein
MPVGCCIAKDPVGSGMSESLVSSAASPVLLGVTRCRSIVTNELGHQGHLFRVVQLRRDMSLSPD